MAPNKKKKKPMGNPSRGFATVSTISKKAGESRLQTQDKTEENSANSELPSVEAKQQKDTVLDNGTSDLQHMSPEELEHHLEESALQALLDCYGQRCKKEVIRHTARLETERRSLRRGGIMLETESWLPDVQEEILELAKVSSSDPRAPKSAGRGPDESDLCIRLWTVQQILVSLRFRGTDDVSRQLLTMFRASPNNDSTSLVSALEDAISWLAMHGDAGDLPAYQSQMHLQVSPPASRDRSPVSAHASGDIIDTSSLSNPRLRGYSPHADDSESNTASKSITPRSPTKDNTPDTNSTAAVSDDSDEDDPEQLVDKFLSAKYELLECSLRKPADQQEAPATGQQLQKLKRRIERIERDVLFDRDEAMARWDHVKRDLEIEHTRSNRVARRQPRLNDELLSADTSPGGLGIRRAEVEVNDDAVDEGSFGGMFALDENSGDEHETAGTPNVTLRDFGPVVGGGAPRKVLEDICKARDPSCKIIIRQISSTSHSYRHSVQIKWSKDQDIAVSASYLPAHLRYDFRPQSTTVSMATIATTSSQHSEGYLCTLILFILSQSAKDDKVYLRLQTVWRNLWKELVEGKQEEIDRADRDALRHIQALIAEERSMQKPDPSGQPEQTASLLGLSESSEPSEKMKMTLSPETLKLRWIEKAATARYQSMLQIRQQLPIWEHRNRITDTFGAHQVTILCAETGAGKSTQVPSFLLQSHLSVGQDCRVVITQPRRISAISLARRVSEELGERKSEIGTLQSLVGYAIRLESKLSSSTRITYVTTGVLLRMLESSKNLEEVDFLVLDEVHERTMDLDLLFIALRRILKRRQSLKVVLMSATVDARKFSEYFDDAPILNIPGRTFPVEVRYLEDAVELTQSHGNDLLSTRIVETYEEDAADRDLSERTRSLTVGLEGYSAQTRKVLAAYDEYKIDYSLIAQLIMTISSDGNLSKYSRGAILIFMPGIAEIRRLHQLIISTPAFQSGWVIHLLHSSFSNEDLERAFERPPAHHRKIVIATNIAETGITIPDVTAVIDSCREKIMRFDERRQLSKLTEAFISRSSSRQRRGRAARVQEGLCFHLVTRYRHDNLLLEHHVPEMLRLSLQDPILRVKVWNLGDIEQTLNEAFDPPSSRNVRRAIQLLKDIKALTDAESLTSLGRQLAKLPLDIWLGKLVLQGRIFGCLDAAVFIAAMLSVKSPFLDSVRSDGRAVAARLAFSKGNSDMLLVYNAYCAWRRACIAGTWFEFCRKNFLNHATLSQIEDQKVQLLVNLSDAGILSLDATEKESLHRSRFGRKTSNFFTVPSRYNLDSHNEFAVNSVIAMALYPKLLARERHGWRNVANNQQVNISNNSINYATPPSTSTTITPNWLSFYQTMQTKSKNPTVFETSAVPETAVVILLGDADFKMYAGVILLDGGKVRFSVRDWKTMTALCALRAGIQNALAHSYRHIGISLSTVDAKWLNIWQRIVTPKKTPEG